ncbi:MAG: hypothetical protein QOF60_1673 [Actinomycetota bacterium]|nr:hypothetical protein [Actinomycetota bacterium]
MNTDKQGRGVVMPGLRRVVLGVVLVAAAMVWPGAAPPAAADPDAGVPCTVVGAFTYGPGLGPVPAAQAVGGGLTVTCVLVGDEAGVWTLPFAGTSVEGCLGGEGTELWAAAATGPEGPVTGGGFTYVRAGLTMDLYGTINAAAEVHQLVAHIDWLPVGPFCVPPTVAGVTVSGLGVITD